MAENNSGSGPSVALAARQTHERGENAASHTKLDVEAIKARAEAATPGPWGYDDGAVYCQRLADERHAAVVAYVEREPSARDPQVEFPMDPEEQVATCDHSNSHVDANQEFIAAARTDVPALLAEVEKLRAALREVVRTQDAGHAPGDADGCEACVAMYDARAALGEP